MKFTCRSCGQLHDIQDISFGAVAPLQWDLITEEERSQSELTGELCIIQAAGETSFYVRACLDVPIRGTDHSFTWGVWVSLSQRSFGELTEHWEDPARTTLGPYFGWLCTQVPEYPETVFLKTMVHPRAVGERPLVELEATDHPLSVDQASGIELTRMQEIVQNVLHS